MWKKRIAISLLAGALLAPAFLGGRDVALEKQRHPASSLEDPLEPGQAPRTYVEKPAAPSLLTRIKNRWRRFRPVKKPIDKDWDQAEKMLAETTLIERVFDEEISQRMKAQYYGTVAPIERLVENPNRWATRREREIYDQSRKGLAEWTVKEVGKDQLKDLLRNHRNGNGALSVILATPRVSETEFHQKKFSEFEEEPEVAPKLSEKERLARAHAYQPPQPAEIPTRLRAKLNVLKRQGAITFMNPVAVAMVEGRADSTDSMAVELNRSFQDLAMSSKVRYGVGDEVLSMNLNKRITREVSLDLYSERWTGDKRGGLGEKSKDIAQMLYSLSF